MSDRQVMTCLRCRRGLGPTPSHQLANLVWCSHNPQPEEAVKNLPSSECIPSSPSSWPVKDEFPNVEHYSVCSRVKKFSLSTLLKQQEAFRDSIARRALGRISKKAKQLGRNVSSQDHSNPTPGLSSHISLTPLPLSSELKLALLVPLDVVLESFYCWQSPCQFRSPVWIGLVCQSKSITRSR